MRILNVNMAIDVRTGGGTAERTVQMTRILRDAGHECAVLTTDLGLTEERTRMLEGVRLVVMPCLFRRYYIPSFSRTEILDLVEWADIIHLMGHWLLLNVIVYRAILRTGRPYVVCPAGSLPLFGRSKILKIFFNLFVGSKIIKGADGHIAVTRDESGQFEAYGVDPTRVRVIPNGVEPTEIVAHDEKEFREKFGIGPEPFILFMGRLNPIKGPDLLVRAFAEAGTAVDSRHLVLAGPDEGLLPTLRKTAETSGVADRVHFIGYVGGEDKSRAYSAADLLVVPSRQEAMSIVALEAGAAGTPVLLTDQCGFPEVEEMGGGKIVPASVEGLRQGLVEILTHPEVLPEMGARLREMVMSRYGPTAIGGLYNDLYREILERRRVTPAPGRN